MRSSLARAIATLGPIGHLKPAPGTWGSLAALPLAYLLHQAGGFLALVLATVLVTGVGIWLIAQATEPGQHDPSEIIIDEVAGQWLALWPVSAGAAMTGTDILALYPGIIAAFLAFRAFDILKPGPVGWADQMETPLGVMLDDIIAGGLAGMVVALLAVFAHLVILL